MSYLLFTEGNPKTQKGEALGFYSIILHLLPFNYSGYQVCPKAQGCEKDCLAFSGRGPMPKTIAARDRKTKLFFEDRDTFMKMMVIDIYHAQLKAKAKNMTLVVRPNGTSDIAWEKIRTATHRNIFEEFPSVQFMDYTKIVGRQPPSNYHLTFSLDNVNELDARAWLQNNRNITAIYDEYIPAEMFGYPTIDGDVTDLRFLDPSPRVVALKRKATRLPTQFKEAA
jgi:hypothetical protein